MIPGSAFADVGFLAGRVLFAFVVGYLAFGNLRDPAGSIAYAQSKGVPFADVAVPLGSGLLLTGALSIVLGVYPLLGGLAIAGFLLPVTVLMHDFWNAEGETAENEKIHFLKNVGLLGATLVLIALTSDSWAYAAGLTL